MTAGALLPLLLALPSGGAEAPSSFARLASRYREGRDFRIVVEDRGSDVTVFAIHGGDIEPPSSELARCIAGKDLNLYLFEGLGAGARGLHLTSARFDEPRAAALASRSKAAVSVHGMRGTEEAVCVGGRNEAMSARISLALQKAGFAVERPCRRLPGASPKNIVNRPAAGGVQLELSWGLSRDLVKNESRMKLLCSAVRAALK